MHPAILRLVCTLFAIVASHSLVAFGTDLPNDNNQQEIVLAPSPAEFSYDSSEVPENFSALLPSDMAIESAFQLQECIDLGGNSMSGMDDSNPEFERAEQHPAPEVVLRFSSGCSNFEFVNWRLSSRDIPAGQPAIPHGPLIVDLQVDRPVDFIELIFDGKPILPTSFDPESPLSFPLPCPAPGTHWLQARYLSGKIWSHYSQPIRFEIRLPQQPQIIAASDFDRNPIPLTRNALTSITSHSLKIHLADVNRGDNIVAYIDGKPMPTGNGACTDCDALTSHSDIEVCCRIVRVQGVVTPGVHKLSVRKVGCPGMCSVTSQTSNEIVFHYYEEDIYLLRPGAGCCNPKQLSAIDKTGGEGVIPTKSAKAFDQFRFVSYPEAPTAYKQTDNANRIPNRAPGRVAVIDAATKQAWDAAEEQAAYEAAGARFDAAKAGSDEHGVRRAQESARAAQTRESHEWSKAASRISEAEANASYARAQAIVGPPSPFYFAAAAHFPIREFGLQGETVEREGILFYEDMKFAFDQHGNYQVHFRATAPKMPATVRLQFQIQPSRNSPWYTITLAPIEFPYPTATSDNAKCSGANCGDDHPNCSDESRNCCGEARECVCKGHSEILRRCYGEMGQDARIRRSGTARFGFGVNVPN